MGKKKTKGVPISRDELKGRHNLMLTPLAWKLLGVMAESLKVSRSELIEMFARGELDKEE